MRCLVWLLITAKVFTADLDYHEEEINRFTKAHIIIVDPIDFEMKAVKAEEVDGISRQSVLDIVNQNKGLAGVNGGFWKVNGDPSGVLKCDGIWHGLASKKRGSIGWNDRKVYIDRLMTIQTDQGVKIEPYFEPDNDWSDIENIVGGVPVLIKKGTIINDYRPEKIGIPTFVTLKHCRTAIGLLKDRRWVFVVISGKTKYISGFTIKELAHYMLKLGCVEAVNLDGGRSSSMVLNDELVNQNKTHNDVSDCIIILPKYKN